LSSPTAPTSPVAPPIAVVLVGAGRWGRALLRSLRHSRRAQVVAVVDSNAIALHRLAQQLDLEPNIARLEDWQQIWTLPQVDALVVATPAATHAPLIQAALQHRCPVLATPPLTPLAHSAKALWTLAQQQDCPLVVAHPYSFHPAVLSGRMALLREELGPVHCGYGRRTQGQPGRSRLGLLQDVALHDLCIFNHWLGCYPIAVMAQGLSWLSPAPGPTAQPPADYIWATVVYPPHTPIQFQWSWANAHPQRQAALVGDRGSLVLDELAHRPLIFHPKPGDQEPVPANQHPHSPSGHPLPVADRDPLTEICEHFIDCVLQNKQSPRTSGREAVDLLLILEALGQSLEQGGAWVPLG